MIEQLTSYDKLLIALREDVRQARLRAGLSVNKELIMLYWRLGKRILEQQQAEGWGAKVVDRLAADLRQSFPEMKGFSSRNLKYMRAFAESYPSEQFVQAGPAQITWHHNCTLLDKVEPELRLFYAEQTIANGWSRDVMVHQIESALHKRMGQAVTNFSGTLPAPQSELAQQVLKDPYNFDFLTVQDAVFERDLERGLIEQIRLFLLELGVGFAFVGSQYHLEVGGQDFYLDLLFYHLKLRCFVVIDLKITDFQPEYAGKMAFYLSAVDECLRHPGDNATIGVILCKSNNRLIAEYTLKNNQSPIGVSEYRLNQALPVELRDNLPAVSELEKRLNEADLLTTPVIETAGSAVYREADILEADFLAAVAEARELWRQRCQEFVDANGDQGCCIVGAGIAVRFLAPRARNWRWKHLIYPHEVTNYQGNLTWETSQAEIIELLRHRGIDSVFLPGAMD
jgi:predicted nuclease of restriction endonuclease-like (RecB) superfamily